METGNLVVAALFSLCVMYTFYSFENNKFYPQLMMKKTISEEKEQLTKKEIIK